MRISGEEVNNVLRAYRQQMAKNAEKTEESQKTSSSEDLTGADRNSGSYRLDLSEEAELIRELKSELEKMPDIRGERVEEIKRQIEDGTYDVGAEEVAEKILHRAIADHLV